MLSRAARILFFLLDAFLGVTALYGAVAVVPTLPGEWLVGSPFPDYTLPALALGAVGVSALLGSLLLALGEPLGALVSAMAGAAIVVFEGVEIAVVDLDVWLHALGLRAGVTPAASAQSQDGIPVWLGVALPLWLQPFYALVGVAIAVLGLGLWLHARRTPAPVPQAHRTYLPSASGMGSGVRVLVAYATGTGSTGEVAATIAQTLSEAGARVDLLPAEEVRSLAGFDAVVLGSAIRAGKLFPAVVRLAERVHRLNPALPMAYFVVCATLHDATPAQRQTVQAYLEPLRRIQAPVDEGLFAGRVELTRLGLLPRTLLRLMQVPEGDWRDWDAIRGWARGLPPRLMRLGASRAA